MNPEGVLQETEKWKATIFLNYIHYLNNKHVDVPHYNVHHHVLVGLKKPFRLYSRIPLDPGALPLAKIEQPLWGKPSAYVKRIDLHHNIMPPVDDMRGKPSAYVKWMTR